MNMSSNSENTQLEQTTDDQRTYTIRGFNKKILDLLASLAEDEEEEEINQETTSPAEGQS